MEKATPFSRSIRLLELDGLAMGAGAGVSVPLALSGAAGQASGSRRVMDRRSTPDRPFDLP